MRDYVAYQLCEFSEPKPQLTVFSWNIYKCSQQIFDQLQINVILLFLEYVYGK